MKSAAARIRAAAGSPTKGYAESSRRPLRRRAARIARPARVRMRSRKPCTRARLRLFGWKVRLLTVISPVVLPATASGQPWVFPSSAHDDARGPGVLIRFQRVARQSCLPTHHAQHAMAQLFWACPTAYGPAMFGANRSRCCALTENLPNPRHAVSKCLLLVTSCGKRWKVVTVRYTRTNQPHHMFTVPAGQADPVRRDGLPAEVVPNVDNSCE